MTRPMPGPPDTMPPVHDLRRPPVGPDGRSDWDTWRRWKEEDDWEWRTKQAKRLTDAECAAEAWHAEAHWARPSLELAMGKRKPSPELHAALHRQIKEAATWFKFMSYPHALEVTP